jgi:hypothetical protein
MTTPELAALVRARFHPPEYAVLEEVPDATGFSKSRTADALVMGLWPSRGLELHGCELKISRADWLREKKNPAKAEAFVPFCDRWWVVAVDAEIVQAGELPPTWGLLVVKGGRLAVVVEAPKLEPQAPTRAFLASLLRQVAAGVPNATIEAEVARRLAEKEAMSRGALKAQADVAQRRVKQLEEAIAEFEKASGVPLHPWNAGECGEAVKALMDGGVACRIQQFEDIAVSAERLGRYARESLEGLRKAGHAAGGERP